jgi:hypothetical protein
MFPLLSCRIREFSQQCLALAVSSLCEGPPRKTLGSLPSKQSSERLQRCYRRHGILHIWHFYFAR